MKKVAYILNGNLQIVTPEGSVEEVLKAGLPDGAVNPIIFDDEQDLPTDVAQEFLTISADGKIISDQVKIDAVQQQQEQADNIKKSVRDKFKKLGFLDEEIDLLGI